MYCTCVRVTRVFLVYSLPPYPTRDSTILTTPSVPEDCCSRGTTTKVESDFGCDSRTSSKHRQTYPTKCLSVCVVFGNVLFRFTAKNLCALAESKVVAGKSTHLHASSDDQLPTVPPPQKLLFFFAIPPSLPIHRSQARRWRGPFPRRSRCVSQRNFVDGIYSSSMGPASQKNAYYEQTPQSLIVKPSLFNLEIWPVKYTTLSSYISTFCILIFNQYVPYIRGQSGRI